MVGKTDHRMALLQSRPSRVSKTVTNTLPLLVIGSSSTFGVLHRVNTMHFCMPEFSVSSQCDTAKVKVYNIQHLVAAGSSQCLCPFAIVTFGEYSGTSLFWTPLDPKKSVLITEMSWFQRSICVNMNNSGSSETVLIRRGVLQERFYCTNVSTMFLRLLYIIGSNLSLKVVKLISPCFGQ